LAGGHENKKPYWLKKNIPDLGAVKKLSRYLKDNLIETICLQGKCPNLGECYGKSNLSFLILGRQCTRNCAFCAVRHDVPQAPREEEPEKIANAVRDIGIEYAVITSVSRDDLQDGGSRHFASVVQSVKRHKTKCMVETLIPDFSGKHSDLKNVMRSGVDVLSHNMETVKRLHQVMRPGFSYNKSLEVLSRARKTGNKDIKVKSGFMVGLGETPLEIRQLMSDIRNAGCEYLAVGQYLRPGGEAVPVARYLPPEEFLEIEEHGKRLGYKGISAGPFVRSSYNAKDLIKKET